VPPRVLRRVLINHPALARGHQTNEEGLRPSSRPVVENTESGLRPASRSFRNGQRGTKPAARDETHRDAPAISGKCNAWRRIFLCLSAMSEPAHPSVRAEMQETFSCRESEGVPRSHSFSSPKIGGPKGAEQKAVSREHCFYAQIASLGELDGGRRNAAGYIAVILTSLCQPDHCTTHFSCSIMKLTHDRDQNPRPWRTGRSHFR
jgi:hypothetical protein